MDKEILQQLSTRIEGKTLRREYIGHDGNPIITEYLLHIRFYWIGRASARFYYSIKSAGMTFQGVLSGCCIEQLISSGACTDKWNNKYMVES